MWLHARGWAGVRRLRLGSWRGLRRAHLVAERRGQLLALQVRRLGDLLLLRAHGIAVLCGRAAAQMLLQPHGLQVHGLLRPALWGLLLNLRLRVWASSRPCSTSSSVRPLESNHGILLLLLLLHLKLLLLLLEPLLESRGHLWGHGAAEALLSSWGPLGLLLL